MGEAVLGLVLKKGRLDSKFKIKEVTPGELALLLASVKVIEKKLIEVYQKTLNEVESDGSQG